MSQPITVTNYTCNACGQQFTSGAGSPQCPRCRSGNVGAQGTAASYTLPDPVPAERLPDPAVIRQQTEARLQAGAQMLSYRCPLCPWSTQWPAIADAAPDTISKHEKEHRDRGEVVT